MGILLGKGYISDYTYRGLCKPVKLLNKTTGEAVLLGSSGPEGTTLLKGKY
jgi:hypothetical protein